MANDIDLLPHLKAAIVIYRDMKDTVRSQFSQHKGPGAFLEAPMESFYGNKLYLYKQRKLWKFFNLFVIMARTDWSLL